MLQTLHKPKFLMPDLLVYLNLLSLIQTRAARINELFSDSVLPSTAKPIFANVFIAPSCLLTCYVKDIQPGGGFGNILLCLTKTGCRILLGAWLRHSELSPTLTWICPMSLPGRFEPSGIPELGLSPGCPCAGRTRLEKILGCVSIILASDSLI